MIRDEITKARNVAAALTLADILDTDDLLADEPAAAEKAVEEP